MKPVKIISFYLLIGIVVVVNGTSPLPNKKTAWSKDGSLYPNSLTYLGTVEGKSFFVDSTQMNWHEASRYCSDIGLHLASVKTEAQAEFLDQSYNEDYFHSIHWTSGRDAFELRQFSWNEDRTEPNSSFINFIPETSFYTCLAYNSLGPITRSHFSERLCTTLNYPVICDTGNPE